MKTEIKNIQGLENEQPIWRKIIIESNIPESLHPLKELSKNLWWVWNNRLKNCSGTSILKSGKYVITIR
jgi:hypothetical protein